MDIFPASRSLVLNHYKMGMKLMLNKSGWARVAVAHFVYTVHSGDLLKAHQAPTYL